MCAGSCIWCQGRSVTLLTDRLQNLNPCHCRHRDLSGVLEAESTATGRCSMKVMVFVKATADSEGAVPPDPKMIEAMHKYNEALIAAGILKDKILGGLKPTRFAKRVH